MFSPSKKRRTWATAGIWAVSAGVTGFYLAVLARSLADERSAAPLQQPSQTSHDQLADLPRVSVIVPARDEERNIRGCVESLLTQTYSNMEVIVVDDGSTDATPTILEELRQTPAGRARLRTLHVAELPAGWAGKPHALHVGAQAATGEWLLFTDADTRHAPGALYAAVERAEDEGVDLFTIGTQQITSDFWSRVLMPIALMGISFMYPPMLVNNPHSRVAIANGQYLLIRRSVYERLGGYDTDTLRATLVDDLALAQVVKWSGGRLLFVDGRDFVATRMYSSLTEHWNGWGKNVAIGSRGGFLTGLAQAPGLPLITIAPFVALGAGLARRDTRLTLAGAAPIAAMLGYRAYIDTSLGIPFPYALTHPLGGAVFTGILVRSFWRKLRGVSVPWRGRSYVV